MITDELKEILHNSTFHHVQGVFIYGKVENVPNLDNVFMISKDDDEITVVINQEYLNKLDLIEQNKDDYALIEIKVAVPFYAVGFLAAITSTIADKEMNVLVISTYSKDYILVRTEHMDMAKTELTKLGMKQI